MLKIACISAIVLLCGMNLFHFIFLFSFINNTFRVFFLIFSQIIYVLLMESLYIFDKIEVKIYYLHIGKRILLFKHFTQRNKKCQILTVAYINVCI